MKHINESIEQLVSEISSKQVSRIEKLPQSGSNRIYYRVYTGDETYIATSNNNIKENETFIQFSKHFLSKNLPVPKILAVNDEASVYLQQDLGEVSLLHVLEQQGFTDEVYQLFQKSLTQLARLQILSHEGFHYSWCLTAKEFGRQAIMSDLLYFKYYFLDTLQLPYDKEAMLNDFESLSSWLADSEYKYFMFRDFQSRNIIIKNNEPLFIDYQGGMQGALQYDVASLLWQAKANLSNEWKNNLLDYYISQVNTLLPAAVNNEFFKSQYNGYVLIRLMQVLGAYGFRGLFERKAHFLSSIPLALGNLKYFVSNSPEIISLPEFDRVLQIIVSDETIKKFQAPQANEHTPLLVEINSFSYKNQIPPDDTGNGGGFVFDCRGILNPGRIDVYKTLSGEDKPVIDYLEQQTRMNEFLNSVFDIIDISLEDYLSRGFAHLQINFGCTGGQHRSVYAAIQTARHLKNKYKVKVKLSHLNKEKWKKQAE